VPKGSSSLPVSNVSKMGTAQMWAANGHHWQLRNSVIAKIYGTPGFGKQGALPTSDRASWVTAECEITAERAFPVCLNLKFLLHLFPPSKAAYMAASRLSPHDFSRWITAHMVAPPIFRHDKSLQHTYEFLCNSMSSAKNEAGIQPASSIAD